MILGAWLGRINQDQVKSLRRNKRCITIRSQFSDPLLTWFGTFYLSFLTLWRRRHSFFLAKRTGTKKWWHRLGKLKWFVNCDMINSTGRRSSSSYGLLSTQWLNIWHTTSVLTKIHRENQTTYTLHQAPLDIHKARTSFLVGLPVTSRYPTMEAWTQDIHYNSCLA